MMAGGGVSMALRGGGCLGGVRARGLGGGGVGVGEGGAAPRWVRTGGPRQGSGWPGARGVALAVAKSASGASGASRGRVALGLPEVEGVGQVTVWRAEGGDLEGQGGKEGAGSKGRRRGGPEEPEVPLFERGAAAVAYLLPLLDALRYGRFLFRDFPLLAIPLLPLQPVVQLYYAFPFVSLIAFFALYLGVVNNPNFSRYVRYNVMQAILVDILLILPTVAESLTGAGSNALLESVDSTSFLFVMACFGYAVPQCFQGKLPRLPLVADSVDRQVM